MRLEENERRVYEGLQTQNVFHVGREERRKANENINMIAGNSAEILIWYIPSAGLCYRSINFLGKGAK
jgi:hypothetical protein